MEEIVKKLSLNFKTIATMESCTGGGLANSITNIEGASEVLRVSLVTYSNEYKIKFGVNEDTIKKYTVYSMEVAKEMSKSVSVFANSNYGIGITGKLNREDKNNITSNNSIVYVSIYDRDNDKYTTLSIDVLNQSRDLNKQLVIDMVTKVLKTII